MENECNWTRPESVPVPTVWARYESKKPMPNGVRPKFRIQDYTEEWKEHVENNMINFFLKDETLCRCLKIRESPQEVEQFRMFFLGFLSKKMGLIAVVDNYEELGDKNLPILAGCNITGILTDKDKHFETTSKKTGKIFAALEALEHQLDAFKHYQVTEYMYALGLSVDSAFRGHGLGCEILKARFPLCKAVGIKVTVTVFTSGAAQRSAEKAGFETLAELFYADYKDENGKIVFDTDEPKSMKLMGIRIS